MNETSVAATAAAASVVARRPAGGDGLGDDAVDLLLDDRRAAGVEHRDLVGGDIDAHHLMPEGGKAGAGDGADIADAEDRDAHGRPRCDRAEMVAAILRKSDLRSCEVYGGLHGGGGRTQARAGNRMGNESRHYSPSSAAAHSATRASRS